MSNEFRVDLEGGKYTVVMEANGNLYALRGGEPWRSLTGDKLVYALAAEVERLRGVNGELLAALEDARDFIRKWDGDGKQIERADAALAKARRNDQ